VLNKPDKPKVKRDDAHHEQIVKRGGKRHEHDEHGGAWKVAFADFCLALMCLFLVLWLMAARQQELIQEVMRAPGGSLMDEGQGVMPETMGGPRGSLIAREPMPRQTGSAKPGNNDVDVPDPTDKQHVDRTRYESASDLQALSRVLARMSEEAGLANNMQAVVTPYGLRVMLHDTEGQGMFSRGSAMLSERFRKLLRNLGPLFAQMENQMLIVGHTDSLQYADRSHSAFSNWTLSSNRAMAARTQLQEGGMPARSILQVVGMADRAPLDTRDAAAGINRRIELLILTSQQAGLVSSMFGMPTDQVALADGVTVSTPDTDALRALRSQLTDTKGRAPVTQ